MPETQDEPVKLDMDAQRQKLLDMRAQLEKDLATKDGQLASSGDELDPERGGVLNHMADDATETFEQEKELALQHAIQRQLDAVNAAMERIDAGTYGTCANCGKQIPAARMEAIPWANYCIDCQQLSDRGKI